MVEDRRKIETIERDSGARQSRKDGLKGAERRIRRHTCTLVDKQKDRDKEEATQIVFFSHNHAQAFSTIYSSWERGTANVAPHSLLSKLEMLSG